MGEILVLCPLMNKSTLAYSTLYSGNTKGNWEKEKSARSELTARFALVELRGLEPLTSTLPVLRTSQLYYSPEARLSLAYLSAPVKSREGGGP